MAGSIESEDGNVGFQIAPMVDVVFVLMIFFMATVGAQQVEKHLAINLPGGSRPGPVGIVIDISDDGHVRMNNADFGPVGDHQLGQLRTWLAETVEAFGTGDPVLIRPSPGARQERIVEVLSAVSAAGLKKLTFS
jgi:biopolymer transport protein ExbD